MIGLEGRSNLFLKDGRLRPVLRGLIFIVVVLVCDAVLTFLIASLAGTDLTGSANSGPSTRLLYIAEASLCISVVLAAFALRRLLDRRSAASLGLATQRGWLTLLALGVALGASMQCAVFVVDEALGYSHVVGLASAREDLAIAAGLLPLLALVAIAEELALRGYLFQNLWEEWGAPAAAMVTSVLFAAMHLGNPNAGAQLWFTVAGLIAYGVWACLSVIWTRSLWPAVGAHLAWNVFEGPVFGFPVSGLDLGGTMIRQTIAGPAWFTGGPFGPEAGASALSALALGLLVLWLLQRSGFFDRFPDRREGYARVQKSSSPSSVENSSSSSP